MPLFQLVSKDICSPINKLVYDIITRRFIAVFYDDCSVSNTTVIGKVVDVKFKTTGKEILRKGWRIVFEIVGFKIRQLRASRRNVLPAFVKGEKGPHEPSFLEKQTKAPAQFTEASLLRAMETAGKQVDDDELRDLMKENGIGRPSTRANIIETLFKRNYIVRNKKQVLPTSTGIQLIDTIQNELLKSAELTGQWEKQLKDIEKGTYSAAAFINNMKQMVDELVYEVRSETVKANIYIRVSFTNSKTSVYKKSQKIKRLIKVTTKSDGTQNLPSQILLHVPNVKKELLSKANTAYGCSAYKSGCDFRFSFEDIRTKSKGKKLTKEFVYKFIKWSYLK